MKIIQVIAIVFGVLLMSGCGDQFWCGENGCAGQGGGNITGGTPAFVAVGDL